MTTLLILALALLVVLSSRAGFHHLYAYAESGLGSVTDSDIDRAADGVFGDRNNHLILTEDYNLIAAYGIGSLMSRLRFGNAQFLVDVQPHINPIEVSATVPDDPAVMDLTRNPLPLPTNEEITLLGTTTAVGPSQISALLFMAMPGWTPQVPNGDGPYWIRATATTTGGGVTSWSNDIALTFERDPRQGVYAVIGAECILANALAFRLVFPDMPAGRNGKQFRPGSLATDNVNLAPWPPAVDNLRTLGEWGRWHTFTPPRLQTLGAAGACEVRLKIVRLGTDRSLAARSMY